MGSNPSKDSVRQQQPLQPRNNFSDNKKQIAYQERTPAAKPRPGRQQYDKLKEAFQNFNSNGNVDLTGSFEWITQAERDLLELKGKLGFKETNVNKYSTEDGRKQKINELRNNLRKAQEERQELLNQISEVAGARLKNNNPGIADLSDENRPAKIAEKFSELYDNEWTNVVECLKERKYDTQNDNEESAERKIIEFLLTIVTSSFQWCKEKADGQLETLKNTLLFCEPKKKWTEEPLYQNAEYTDTLQVPVEVQKRCKEMIKKHSTNQIQEYEQLFRTERLLEIFDKKEYKKYSEMKANHLFSDYINKCVTLSWYMCIQDPPVAMVWDTQNTIQYRAYTRSGKNIQFVVWPALLLNKDGPLLYKGVSQFVKDGMKISSSGEKGKVSEVVPEANSQQNDDYFV